MSFFPIVDAHEDLAFNGLLYGRDYRRSAYAIRKDEAAAVSQDGRRGRCMLGVPELLEAQVAVVFATIYTLPATHAEKGEHGYNSPQEAQAEALRQFALYECWIAEDARLGWVRNRAELKALLTRQQNGLEPQVGVVLLIENADCITQLSEVGEWYERGVRIIGPAWHRNAYTGSSGEPGPLTEAGRALLGEMERAGVALDISHMSDEAMREALERYRGPVCSSHANPRAVADRPRQLPSWALEEIGRRGGVAGIMPVNWALDPEWQPQHGKARVGLARVAAAIQAAAEIAGGYRFVGIGSDFDGGFGAESCPEKIETVGDLGSVARALSDVGVPETEICAVMGGNWLRWLETLLRED